MKKLKIVLAIDFPSLNHVINEAKKGGEGIAYSDLKLKLTNKVKLLANNQYLAQKSPKFDKKISFLFEWYSGSQRKDPDNIEFATKFICDGLKKLGVYKDDSYKLTSGIKIHRHIIDKEYPRVEIYIQENDEAFSDYITEKFKNLVIDK